MLEFLAPRLLVLSIVTLIVPQVLRFPFLLPSLVLLSYTLLGPIPIYHLGNFTLLPYHIALTFAFAIVFMGITTGQLRGYTVYWPSSRKLIISFVLFLIILSLSFLRSPDNSFGLWLLLNHAGSLALVIIIVATLKTVKYLQLTMRTLLIVTAIGGALGVLQAIFGPRVSVAYLFYGEEWTSAWGIVGYGSHPFSFGLSMMIGFIPATALYLTYRRWAICAENRESKAILFAAMTLGLTGIALSGSRSTWVGSLIGMIYLLMGLGIKYYWRKTVALVFILIAIIWIFSLVSPVSIAQRKFKSLYAGDIRDDFSFRLRIALLQAGIDLWHDAPFWGIGIGRFKEEVARYLPSDIAMATTHPHNVFLGVLVETGLIGLVSYLAILFFAFMSCVNRPQLQGENQYIRTLSISFRATLVGYVVDSLFHNYFFDNHLWFVVGLMLVCGNLMRFAQSVNSSRPEGKPRD